MNLNLADISKKHSWLWTLKIRRLRSTHPRWCLNWWWICMPSWPTILVSHCNVNCACYCAVPSHWLQPSRTFFWRSNKIPTTGPSLKKKNNTMKWCAFLSFPDFGFINFFPDVCLATLNFPSQAKFNFPFANLKKKHYLIFWRKTEAAWYDRDLIIL